MYTTRPDTTDSYNESKYTVADILSCMANGEPLTPAYSGAGPSFVSGTPTGTTPILTPTTLANLEQSFIELQSVPAAQDLSRQSGFVPPVINPVTSAPDMVQDYTDSFSESDDDWEPEPANKRTKLNAAGGYATTGTRRQTGPRRSRNEKLTPEEDARRSVRRERNKVAAAKCRQRRVDLTNQLMNESDNLEEEKAGLENEIQTLQQQKEQLEFLLQAHTPMCNAKHTIRDIVVKNEPGLNVSAIIVKPDPDRLCNTLQQTISNSRPNSLSIAAPTITTNVTMATGVPITTPSNGVGFSFIGLDSMVDGHTGLTPITGPSASCASQIQRNSSDSSPNEALNSPTTLMAL